MDDRQVFEWLREKVCQTRGIRPDIVTPESTLAEDLVPDSFEMIEIVSAIETKYKFNVDYDQFADIQTVNQVVRFIQKHRRDQETTT